ncbi:hypothetical protein [Comamonas jiangduensis]|jgi:hypothetical protein
MDIRYANALRNATNAWSNNRTTDTITMQDLKRRAPDKQDVTQVVTAPNPTQMAAMQPELARYGNLGTRLNLFA